MTLSLIFNCRVPAPCYHHDTRRRTWTLIVLSTRWWWSRFRTKLRRLPLTPGVPLFCHDHVMRKLSKSTRPYSLVGVGDDSVPRSPLAVTARRSPFRRKSSFPKHHPSQQARRSQDSKTAQTMSFHSASTSDMGRSQAGGRSQEDLSRRGVSANQHLHRTQSRRSLSLKKANQFSQFLKALACLPEISNDRRSHSSNQDQDEDDEDDDKPTEPYRVVSASSCPRCSSLVHSS